MMRKNRALSYEDIKMDEESFYENKDNKLDKIDIIGQDRAVKAMDFGLQIKAPGYNIYMSGPTGTGKTSYAKIAASFIAMKESTPWEWCYVYNFKNNNCPLALTFPPGQGRKFQNNMEEFIKTLTIQLLKSFQEKYEKEKVNS